MIIPINEKFRIQSTKDCWQVEEYREWTDGQTDEIVQKWTARWYFTTLQDALRGVLRREIRLVEGNLGVEGNNVLEAVQKLEDQYKAVCQKIDAEWVEGEIEEMMERRRNA